MKRAEAFRVQVQGEGHVFVTMERILGHWGDNRTPSCRIGLKRKGVVVVVWGGREPCGAVAIFELPGISRI